MFHAIKNFFIAKPAEEEKLFSIVELKHADGSIYYAVRCTLTECGPYAFDLGPRAYFKDREYGNVEQCENAIRHYHIERQNLNYRRVIKKV